MRTFRAPRASLAIIAILILVPASASLRAAEEGPVRVTYYLHGLTPAGNAQTLLEFTVGVQAYSMDETPPSGVADKTMAASGLGNEAFRKNPLLAYWAGAIRGPTSVSNVTASIWVSVANETTLAATIFGDGSVGTGSPFGIATKKIPAGGPALVTFDFGTARSNVIGEIVFQIRAMDASAGAIVHYDSALRDSRVSFELGDTLDTPPPVWIPAPGWGPVVLINDTSAAREESFVISPTDPNVMIACAPSGVPSTGNGQSYFHISRDAGATWSYLQVETASTDPRRFAFEGGDCDFAFDAAGNMYSADTWLGSLSVGVSRDGGYTWTGTSLASSAPVVDRPWIVGGADGVLHLTWQDVQFGMPSAIWYARSVDHGLTFTPAVSVTTANDKGAFTWTGNLVVADGGNTLYSIYTRRAGPAINSLDGSGPETVWVARSLDGGLTWTQHLVASMPQPASYLYPSLDVDAAGGLHAVFASRSADLSDRPIWYASSSDGGQSWSAPLALMRGVAAFSPWVVSDGAGKAAIAWYGSDDPAANLTGEYNWYFYTARVAHGVVTSAGPTTTTAIFTGAQDETPEFNQLRIDAAGKINLGQAAMHTTDGATGWALFWQREL